MRLSTVLLKQVFFYGFFSIKAIKTTVLMLSLSICSAVRMYWYHLDAVKEGMYKGWWVILGFRQGTFITVMKLHPDMCTCTHTVIKDSGRNSIKHCKTEGSYPELFVLVTA